MSGRGRGGHGLAVFRRSFEAEHTVPLLLHILPKKYHKELHENMDSTSEKTLHEIVNHVFQGDDIRDDLATILSIPPRFRFVRVKETRPQYERYCQEYAKRRASPAIQKQQAAATPLQEKKTKLKCDCAPYD